MKTNISIELTDKERMNLGQKFYKKKRMITRADLNQIVKKFINDVIEATPPSPQERLEDPLLTKEWTSLSQLKDYLLKQGQNSIVHFDGFELIVKDKQNVHHSYTLGDQLYKQKKGLPK